MNLKAVIFLACFLLPVACCLFLGCRHVPVYIPNPLPNNGCPEQPGWLSEPPGIDANEYALNVRPPEPDRPRNCADADAPRGNYRGLENP
jgi:hypothetical protein